MAMESESGPPPKYSPNKRLKILTPTLDDYPPHQSPPSLISKGKSKIEEDEIELTDCCGICLSESGGDCNISVSRGYIDSCSHYFCFVCIMEWAKVESKCPLCKRRFSTIRRPPKPPIFPSERVVQVPVRDQIYYHFGNTTVGPPDPYSQVKCSICNCSADESLLLLCDLCDSAAHTYCVGLGATVPDGDWFCQDCKLLKDEQAENEMNTDPGNQISSGPVIKLESWDEHVCIFDIVREPRSTVIQRTRNVPTDPRNLPSPSSTTDEVSMTGKMCIPSSRRQESFAQHTTKSNARTLRHCRNVRDRIHVLRKNWNRFQSGALTFSSSRGDGSISSQEPITSRSSNQPHSSSCLNQRLSGESGSGDIQVDNSRAHEIDKAWKMMEIAKTIGQSRGKSSMICKDSKHPTKKLIALKQADSVSSKHLQTKSQQGGYNELASSKFISTSGPHKTIDTDREKVPGKESFSGSARLISLVSESLASNIQHVKEVNHTSSSGSKPMCSKDKNEVRHSCVGRNTDQVYDAKSDIRHVKEANRTSSSSSKPRCTKEKNEVGNSCVDRKANKASDAKSEIQSLVKLNLKLQTKDEKLEVDVYKEVARLATHSILAACGSEQLKPEFCSLPGPICSHPNEVRQYQRSTLMPNSCRKCFYEFVKDVVSTILLQNKKVAKK